MSAQTDTEELCKVSFTAFLLTMYPPCSVKWKKVSPINEPPDYYVSIGGECFAVEVTTIMEKPNVGVQSLPQAAIRASLKRFGEEVKRVAEEEGCLSGTYLVMFFRPIKNFGSYKKDIRKELLAYIRDTRTASSAPEEVVFHRPGMQKCTTKKLYGRESKVLVVGPTNSKWECEAAPEICALLQERLDIKCHKLRNIPTAKILLLYDAYLLAEPAMFKDCLSKLTNLDKFHSIFIARSRDTGFLLYSEKESWLRS